MNQESDLVKTSNVLTGIEYVVLVEMENEFNPSEIDEPEDVPPLIGEGKYPIVVPVENVRFGLLSSYN